MNSTTKDASNGFLVSDMQELKHNWRLNESAMTFVSRELGVDLNDVGYHKGWSGSNGKFAFVKQHVVCFSFLFFLEVRAIVDFYIFWVGFKGGIPVANAIANVAYNNKDLRVFSFGSSFIDTTNGKRILEVYMLSSNSFVC